MLKSKGKKNKNTKKKNTKKQSKKEQPQLTIKEKLAQKRKATRAKKELIDPTLQSWRSRSCFRDCGIFCGGNQISRPCRDGGDSNGAVL